MDEVISGMVNSGRSREAIKYAKNMISELALSISEIHTNHLDELDAAIGILTAACDIDTNNVSLHAQCASFLIKSHKYTDAVKICEKVKGKDSDNIAKAELYFNYGQSLMYLSRLKDAEEAYKISLAFNPKDAMVHVQFAQVLLAQGHFKKGLLEDEWRFKAFPFLQILQKRYGRFWDGEESLFHKKILVFNEQGCGDAINFLPYVKSLKNLGAYVILEVQTSLVKLFENCDFIDEIIGRDIFSGTIKGTVPEHDFSVSLGSLLSYFDPDLWELPLETPYLKAKNGGEEAIKLIKSDKMKVGLVWAGNHFHNNDRKRSCFLKTFKPLSELCQLYSLQKGPMERCWSTGPLWDIDETLEVVNLKEGSEDINIIDLAPYIHDFNDTAIVLKHLDLLISVDTSAAHLAGALNVPVWLMIPWGHEWRWLKKWYPSMTIYKQSIEGCWDSVVEKIANNLS